MRSEERGDALAALAGGNTHIEGEGKEREDKEDKEDTVAEEVPLEKATQIRAHKVRQPLTTECHRCRSLFPSQRSLRASSCDVSNQSLRLGILE